MTKPARTPGRRRSAGRRATPYGRGELDRRRGTGSGAHRGGEQGGSRAPGARRGDGHLPGRTLPASLEQRRVVHRRRRAPRGAVSRAVRVNRNESAPPRRQSMRHLDRGAPPRQPPSHRRSRSVAGPGGGRLVEIRDPDPRSARAQCDELSSPRQRIARSKRAWRPWGHGNHAPSPRSSNAVSRRDRRAIQARPTCSRTVRRTGSRLRTIRRERCGRRTRCHGDRSATRSGRFRVASLDRASRTSSSAAVSPTIAMCFPASMSSEIPCRLAAFPVPY